jgi:hypothetical protein
VPLFVRPSVQLTVDFAIARTALVIDAVSLTLNQGVFLTLADCVQPLGLLLPLQMHGAVLVAPEP